MKAPCKIGDSSIEFANALKLNSTLEELHASKFAA